MFYSKNNKSCTGKEIGGEKDKVTNGENAEQTVESVVLGSPTQIPEGKKTFKKNV